MDIKLHVYLHQEEPLLSKVLDEVRALRMEFNQKEIAMTAEFDKLQAEVSNSVTVQASVVALVNGLATQIEALKNDPVKLQALADQLAAADTATAAVVLANTPAATTEPTPIP